MQSLVTALVQTDVHNYLGSVCMGFKQMQFNVHVALDKITLFIFLYGSIEQ